MMQDPKKKEVGEMGKPSLKAKFEAAMQKQYKSRPENKPPLKEDIKKTMTESWKEVMVPVKKKSSKLSMMTKAKY